MFKSNGIEVINDPAGTWIQRWIEDEKGNKYFLNYVCGKEVDDSGYSKSLLVTSQALAVAMGALAEARQSIISGTPSTHAIGQIEKAQAKVRELMA